MPDDVHLDSVGNDQRPRLIPIVKSEVSVLIRQARLRKISTMVRAELYTQRHSGPDALVMRELSARQLDAELTQWRIQHIESTVPLSQCVFDTVEYMDINFHRERLFIYSALALPYEWGEHSFKPDIKHLRCCLESAVQIVGLFQILLDRGVVIPLW